MTYGFYCAIIRLNFKKQKNATMAKNLNVDPKKVQSIKSLIASSPLASEFTRKICFQLLEQYQKTGNTVSITLFESEEISRFDMIKATGEFEDLSSSARCTKLNTVVAKLGISMEFMAGLGYYNEDQQFFNKFIPTENGDKAATTFWFCIHGQHHKSEHLIFKERFEMV